jgi:hypothetical protein
MKTLLNGQFVESADEIFAEIESNHNIFQCVVMFCVVDLNRID